MVMFAVNALVHVSTTYPDAGGYQSACTDPKYHVAGSWMFGFISTESETQHEAAPRSNGNKTAQR
jgi:hypothetical protein